MTAPLETLPRPRGTDDEVLIRSEIVTDTDVAADIRRAIVRDLVGMNGIRVEVDCGTVTLQGLVLSYVERQQAERAAWTVSGVREVINKIITVR